MASSHYPVRYLRSKTLKFRIDPNDSGNTQATLQRVVDQAATHTLALLLVSTPAEVPEPKSFETSMPAVRETAAMLLSTRVDDHFSPGDIRVFDVELLVGFAALRLMVGWVQIKNGIKYVQPYTLDIRGYTPFIHLVTKKLKAQGLTDEEAVHEYMEKYQ
jgi:mRNA degradation ribonuclease J1/J2